MTRTKVVLIALAALAFTAWINAAQEHRGCSACSPAISMAPLFAIDPR
ncbi:MAG: hypothetical protein ACREKL_12070 [Chthoniobacterales bacterium]